MALSREFFFLSLDFDPGTVILHTLCRRDSTSCLGKLADTDLVFVKLPFCSQNTVFKILGLISLLCPLVSFFDSAYFSASTYKIRLRLHSLHVFRYRRRVMGTDILVLESHTGS